MVLQYSGEMIYRLEDMDNFYLRAEDGTYSKVNLDTLCRQAAAEFWPDRELKDVFRKINGGTNWPIQKGDTIIANNAKLPKPKKLDYLAGMFKLNAKAYPEYPPMLSYRNEAGKNVELHRDNAEDMAKIKKLFAGGNYARAELSMVPNARDNGNYLTFYYNHVTFRKVGERLGGAGNSLNSFDGIEGGEADFDPTQDALDDI
jgi:hypothetical protein